MKKEEVGSVDKGLGEELNKKMGWERVKRMGKWGGESKWKNIIEVIINRCKFEDEKRWVVEKGIRCKEMLKRRKIEKGIERGRRLEMRIGKEVKMDGRIVKKEKNGEKRESIIDGKKREMDRINIFEVMIDMIIDRILEREMEVKIDGSMEDDVIIWLEDKLGKLGEKIVGKIVLRKMKVGRRESRWLDLGNRKMNVVDNEFIENGEKKKNGERWGGLRVEGRGEERRRFKEKWKSWRLNKVKVIGRFVEIEKRWRIEEERERKKIKKVKINIKYMVIGIFMIKKKGENKLMKIEIKSEVRRKKEIIGKMMCKSGEEMKREERKKIG